MSRPGDSAEPRPTGTSEGERPGTPDNLAIPPISPDDPRDKQYKPSGPVATGTGGIPLTEERPMVTTRDGDTPANYEPTPDGSGQPKAGGNTTPSSVATPGAENPLPSPRDESSQPTGS